MSTEDKLKDQLDKASWHALKPHFERGGLILVNEDLDLVKVGVSIAEDQVKEVQELLDKKLITKPLLDDIKTWADDKPFCFIIIQPYVLIQNRPN